MPRTWSIAFLATQAAAAHAAAEAGSEAIDEWLDGAGGPLMQYIAAASAKIRTGEAAGQACAIAHQVFGVPLFLFRGEQFWGNDRIEVLEARLAEAGLAEGGAA